MTKTKTNKERTVVFWTETLLPIEAITVFGMHAKPNSDNPIGYFGTGLKFAISTIMRHRCGITIDIGLTNYRFYTEQEEFRGETFNAIYMEKSEGIGVLNRLQRIKLPFTTELGKNWELWQAFRELESNTRDENGSTVLGEFIPNATDTGISITGAKFIKEYYQRHDTFLRAGLEVIHSNSSIEVLARPSKYVYYRGLRVHELPKSSVFTYNIKSYVTLTEDRTMKYAHYELMQIANLWAVCEDVNILGKVIYAANVYWEHTIDFNVGSVLPSKTFVTLAKKRNITSPSAWAFASNYAWMHRPPAIVEKPAYTVKELLSLATFDTVEQQICANKYISGAYNLKPTADTPTSMFEEDPF